MKFLQHRKCYYSQKLPIFICNCKKQRFLSGKFANTRSTKALRDSAAVHKSQPTPATLMRKGMRMKDTFDQIAPGMRNEDERYVGVIWSDCSWLVSTDLWITRVTGCTRECKARQKWQRIDNENLDYFGVMQRVEAMQCIGVVASYCLIKNIWLDRIKPPQCQHPNKVKPGKKSLEDIDIRTLIWLLSYFEICTINSHWRSKSGPESKQSKHFVN